MRTKWIVTVYHWGKEDLEVLESYKLCSPVVGTGPLGGHDGAGIPSHTAKRPQKVGDSGSTRVTLQWELKDDHLLG